MLKDGDKIQVISSGRVLTVKNEEFLKDLFMKGISRVDGGYTSIDSANWAVQEGHAIVVNSQEENQLIKVDEK